MEEQQEKELVLRVFEFGERSYVIGLVDLDSLNTQEFAFNINHALFIEYNDNIENYIIFEDAIVDCTMIFNLSKAKTVSIFSPTEAMAKEYFELAYSIVNRESGEFDDQEDDNNYNDFYQVGKIQ